MPRITKRDPSVAKAIRDAAARLQQCEPRDRRLKARVDAGTLRVNFNTVEVESGVKRHLFDRPGTPYHAEHEAIAAMVEGRGTVEPLRKQLDRERELLREARLRLDRSRSYAAQLLVRMQKLDTEVARLAEIIAGGSDEGGDGGPLIGMGIVTNLPPVRRARQPGKRSGPRQTRGVGT